MRQGLDKFSSFILRFVPFTLAFFVPLFFLPVTNDPFTYNKFYLVTILASVSLLAWCLRSLARGKLSFTASPALLPLIVLVVVHIISSIWLSPITHASLFGQTTFFLALLIIFVTTTSSQKSRALIDSVILGLILSASLLSLLSLLSYFGLIGKIISSDLLTAKGFSPTGGNLIALTFTLPILFSTICYLIVTQDWLHKSLLFAGVILMIVASLINLTLLFPQSGQTAIFLLPLNASWSIAVDVFKSWSSALFGTGPDTYLSAFTRLRPGYLNLSPSLWPLRFPESGSYVLTLATTVGLFGALGFVFSFLRPLLVAYKHRAPHLQSPSFVFLTMCLLVTLVSFFLTPASIASLVLGFVCLIALTLEFKIFGLIAVKDISYSLSAKNEGESFYQNLNENTSLSPYSVVLPWIVTLLSIVLLALYWSYAIPAYSASVAIKNAGDMISSNPVGAYLQEVNAAKLDPYNSNYPMLLSQFFKNASLALLNKKSATADDKKNATDYLQRSIDFGKQAVTLNPYNVMMWENLADIYQSFIGVADGSSNFAVSHLAQAISLDPSNPQLRLKLGVLFFNLGDSDQAIKLVSQAIELKQNWEIPYYNLALIYRDRKDYTRALQYLQAGLPLVDQTSDTFNKFQTEITALQKLGAVPAASTSASPK